MGEEPLYSRARGSRLERSRLLPVVLLLGVLGCGGAVEIERVVLVAVGYVPIT